MKRIRESEISSSNEEQLKQQSLNQVDLIPLFGFCEDTERYIIKICFFASHYKYPNLALVSKYWNKLVDEDKDIQAFKKLIRIFTYVEPIPQDVTRIELQAWLSKFFDDVSVHV